MAHPKEIYFPTTMVAIGQEGGLRAPVESCGTGILPVFCKWQSSQ